MENIGILNSIVGLVEKLYHTIIPPKPYLNFELMENVHFYDVDNFQSGIIFEMFIINRGNKTTTIRKFDIVNMHPDHLKYKQRIQIDPIELPKGKDHKFRKTVFFDGDYLRYERIELTLEFTHSDNKETLETESKLISRARATII